MKAIEALKAKLEAIGAKLDDSGYTLHCDAPKGYVWSSHGMTCLNVHYATNSQTWLVAALKDAKSDFDMGLEKVTDPNELAEIRHNNDDDTWGAPTEAPARIEWPK